ncbi:MAG: CDP-alcohol phosphatidyltransferase family protein [Solirubrobacteraceae bacterium]
MARASIARLIGLDRSGPPPPQTIAGSPLKPWTIPNLIGAIRLSLIPAFLAVALIGETGVSALAVVLFAICGWGDYADGIAARITGQYSRLGTLMDPLTDRLLAVSAAAVCWRYELLPRWAIALMVARELAMLMLARIGLSRGIDVNVNWPGRAAVLPLMGGLFLAMAGVRSAGEVCFLIGVALALLALALYVRRGTGQAPPDQRRHRERPV